MNIHMPQEILGREISRHASAAIAARQVCSRLNKLLPVRLKALQKKHAAIADSAGDALRMALNDKEYISLIDELVDITKSASEARIQYETHMMLVDARASLRAFRARNG